MVGSSYFVSRAWISYSFPSPQFPTFPSAAAAFIISSEVITPEDVSDAVESAELSAVDDAAELSVVLAASLEAEVLVVPDVAVDDEPEFPQAVSCIQASAAAITANKFFFFIICLPFILSVCL